MKYKGFIIVPVYFTGSTFKINKAGCVVERQPTRKDVEYYEVLDTMCGNGRFCADFTVEQCKTSINKVLGIMGMPANTPKYWALLEG